MTLKKERLWSTLKSTGSLLFRAGKNWVEDDASTQAAAVAYFAMFSIVPLLIILTTVLTAFYDQETARQSVEALMLRYFNPETTALALDALDRMKHTKQEGLAASGISIAVILYGAGKVFVQIQVSLNRIWRVRVKPRSGWKTALPLIRDRALSVAMVVGVVLVLLASLILQTVVQATSARILGDLAHWPIWAQSIGFVSSYLVYSALFAMVFKFVPDIEISWRAVAFGSFVTALLFLLGQWALSALLSFDSTPSIYGAAGALVSFLLWIYYSGLVIFFGAELTKVQAGERGWHVEPSSHATWMATKAADHDA